MIRRSRGFTLGELLIVFAVTASLLLVFTPVMRVFRQRHAHVECENNLKKIGIALYMYANRNEGVFPSSLQKLYEHNYLSDESIMDCPGSHAVGTVHLPDYHYVPSLSVKTSENQPVVYDKTGNHPGDKRNILYLDGRIQKKAVVASE